MNDPVRLAESNEASELERELLVAGQTQGLPEGERRALWAGIALSLPTHPPLPGLAEPGVTHGALAGYLTKGLLFLAVVGGLGVGLVTWSSSSSPKAGASAAPSSLALPAALTAPPSLSATVRTELEPPVASPASVAPRLRSASPASQLREESALVLAARSALRAGDATRCLSLLDTARQRFPRPALGQEREALTIQALARTGQTQAAKQRAARFVRAYPESPYVADLRRLAEP
jgi:hypothetical protein